MQQRGNKLQTEWYFKWNVSFFVNWTGDLSQVTSHKLKIKEACFLWLGLISKGNIRRTRNIYKLS